MQDQIQNNLDKPDQLEKLYRQNRQMFKQSFNAVYPEILDEPLAQFWFERLNYQQDEQDISWGKGKELLYVLLGALIAGFIAKLPQFANLDTAFFYSRNIAFIGFPLLTLYFGIRQGFELKKWIVIAFLFLVSVIYINILPDHPESDTLILACIHLPLFLWTILGYSFTGGQLQNYSSRLDFLRYNGDLVVMAALLMIAGAILTGVTMGLFSLIEVDIEEFYFDYVVVFGLAAIPVFGTFLVRNNTGLVNKVSPVIARVFTPLVLITLIAYLIAIVYSGKNPYTDREFLFIFNLLLIGVMAIILFSVAELSKNKHREAGIFMLFLLSLATIIVNGIALSAILYRTFEYGITPNRLAVMGGNALILINLLMVSFRLFNSLKHKDGLVNVEKNIALFLPVYGIWTVIVTFLFPVLFGFR